MGLKNRTMGLDRDGCCDVDVNSTQVPAEIPSLQDVPTQNPLTNVSDVGTSQVPMLEN